MLITSRSQVEPDTAGKVQERYPSALFFTLAGICLALTLFVWLGSLHIGFVADDYAHLIQDANLAKWKSSDALFRPLRNLLLHSVLFPLFGTNPEPYRFVILFLYAATMFAVWSMARRFSGNAGALVALAVFALYPRNYPLLLWPSSCQDLIFIPLIAGGILLWLRSRWGWAVACYVVALGFKETAIVFPVLLFLADFFIRRQVRIRPYVPLALVSTAYAGLVVGSGIRNVAKSDGIYGFSLFGGPLAELRGIANLALPFRSSFGLRDINVAGALLIAAILGTLTLLVIMSRRPRVALFGIAWCLVALAPTSFFARSANADHYFMFPLVGVVITLAAVVEGQEIAALCAALIFSVAGYGQLLDYRHQWKEDADRVVTLEREIHAKVTGPSLRITLVDVNHSGLSTAVRGALIEAGIPRTVPVRYNFADATKEQKALVDRVNGCAVTGGADRTYLYQQGVLLDVTGSCATEKIDEDVRSRPYAWF